MTERDVSTVTAAAKITGDLDCSRNQDIVTLFKEGTVLNSNFCVLLKTYHLLKFVEFELFNNVYVLLLNKTALAFFF